MIKPLNGQLNSPRSKHLRGTLIGLSLAIGLLMSAAIAQALPRDASSGSGAVENPSSSTRSRSAEQDTFPFAASPLVARLLNEVSPSEVYSLTGYLSGVFPISLNGALYSLKTRNTASQDILTATQYVRDFLQDQGIAAGYQGWSGEDQYGNPMAGRSVVGVITGTRRPSEIVLVVAHLDDQPDTGRAPGADDNASGSAAAMMTAARLAGHRFERTVRFLFTTDEENEQLSAYTYADAARTAHENILAVYNMDMIGWDDQQAGAVYLETRYTSAPGYSSDLAIANVFIQVVNAYGLTALHPAVDPCYDDGVDSRAFWDNGFSGITAIEDYDQHIALDPNSNHTANDTLATLNMPFFTSFVKASVGTVAHLAGPLELDLPDKVYLPLIRKR